MDLRLRHAGPTPRGVFHLAAERAAVGPGVPIDLRSRIFERFFTTKPAGVGTGLGLSLAHTFALEHQGRIFFCDESSLGGARFTLALPLLVPAVLKPAASAAQWSRRLLPATGLKRSLPIPRWRLRAHSRWPDALRQRRAGAVWITALPGARFLKPGRQPQTTIDSAGVGFRVWSESESPFFPTARFDPSWVR